MKWKYFPIAASDARGKHHLLKSLSAGAYEHTLSRALKACVSEVTGPLVLVAFESLDMKTIIDYSYAGFYGGKGLHDAVGSQFIPQKDSPVGGLALFI